MFLVSMDMRSHGGESLRQASRSTMLRYKSSLLQTISTMAFAPFFLYGVQEEKQMVTVELFSQYEEDPVSVLVLGFQSSSFLLCISSAASFLSFLNLFVYLCVHVCIHACIMCVCLCLCLCLFVYVYDIERLFLYLILLIR